jgi:cell division protein FtsN
MARRAAKKAKSAPSRLLWLFFGFTIGLGAAALLVAVFNELPTPFVAPPTRALQEENLLQKPAEKGEDAFEFHRILKSRAPQSLESPASQAPPPANLVFYLQAGAFRDRAAAEQMKGELALLGQPAKINEGKLAGGDALYRVWIGPFAAAAAAESARAELALSGYNASVLQAAE